MAYPPSNLLTADYPPGGTQQFDPAGGVGILWANRPSAITIGIGAMITVTDIGVNGYTVFVSDGAVWRLLRPTDFLVDLIPVTGAAGTVAGNQLLKQWTPPVGLLTSLRYFSIKTLWYKGATSDTLTCRLRIGSNPAGFSDPQLGANISLTTTSRSFAAEMLFAATSTTNLRAVGSQGGGSQVSAWPGAVNASSAYPNDQTVANLDAPGNIISASMSFSTGTDSATSGIAHMIVTGY